MYSDKTGSIITYLFEVMATMGIIVQIKTDDVEACVFCKMKQIFE